MKRMTWAEVEAHNAKVFNARYAGRVKSVAGEEPVTDSAKAACPAPNFSRETITGSNERKVSEMPAERVGQKSETDAAPYGVQGTPRLTLLFYGQIKGGKNNMVVTRTGHRFPKKSWAEWRDKQVSSVKNQLPKDFKTITEPTNIYLTYIAGDKRRRDMPAIVDSIFHVLEKAQVVKDDTLLWISKSERNYDNENPMAVIEFL